MEGKRGKRLPLLRAGGEGRKAGLASSFHRGPVLGLMLSYYHLEILSNF